MLSGRTASRAVRGHFLTDSALSTSMAAKVLGIDVSQETQNKTFHSNTQSKMSFMIYQQIGDI
jgi:hypothetical protein